jgi:hypothetical protein
MIATFHLSGPWLAGPAERTVIQPWLTYTPSHLALNAYTEVHADDTRVAPLARRLTAVEPVPAPRPLVAPPRRVALAA